MTDIGFNEEGSGGSGRIVAGARVTTEWEYRSAVPQPRIEPGQQNWSQDQAQVSEKQVHVVMRKQRGPFVTGAGLRM